MNGTRRYRDRVGMVMGGFALLSCLPRLAFAQADFFEPLGSSIIDTKLDSEINAPEQQAVSETNFVLMRNAAKSAKQPGATLTEAKSTPPAPLFRTKRLFATYGYSYRHSKLADATNTRGHGITPKLYLETGSGLSISPGFTYVNSTSRDNARNRSETDTFGFSLALGQDLLPLFLSTERTGGCDEMGPTERWQIVPSVDAGYRTSSKASRPFAGAHSSSDQDAWNAGGGIGFSYRWRNADNICVPDRDKGDDTGKLVTTLTPSYRYDEKRNVPGGTVTKSTTQSELFALQARLDYVVARNLSLTAIAAWYHDVDQDVPAGNPQPDNEDWAEFGLQSSIVLSKQWKAKATGSYEAFNSNYYNYRFGIEVSRTF